MSSLISSVALLFALLVRRWVKINLPKGWVSSYLRLMRSILIPLNINNNKVLAILYLLPFISVAAISYWLVVVNAGFYGTLLCTTLLLWLILGDTKIRTDYESVLVQAHEQNFGIIFWFMVLGPVGGICYWFLAVPQDEASELHWLHALAAWLPARVTGFIYALVGNFSHGYNKWLDCMRLKTMHSSKVLYECGSAAILHDIQSQEQVLVKRALYAWVVLCVMVVLIIF